MRNKAVVLCCTICFLLITACAELKPVNTVDNNKRIMSHGVQDSIDWFVGEPKAYTYQIDDKAEIFNLVQKNAGIRINVSFNDESFLKELLLRQQASQIPDIITLPVQSILNARLAGMKLCVPVSNYEKQLIRKLPETACKLFAASDGQLYAVPGGSGYSSEVLYAREGIYVNSDFYHILGDPPLRTKEDLLDIIAIFIQKYSMMSSKKGYGVLKPVPVFFGKGNSGMSTLEHVFGIYPIDQEGKTARHRVHSEEYREFLGFLSKLGQIPGFQINGLEFYDKRINEVLEKRCLIYIGDAQTVEAYNMLNPQNRYISLDLPFTEQGTLSAYSPYGRYLTYVLSQGKVDAAIKVISYLSSEAGTRLCMYGIENKHWISSDGKPVRMGWIQEGIERNRGDIMKKTGIGQLPYLSFSGFDIMPEAYIRGKVSDMSLLDLCLKAVPTAREAIVLDKINESLYGIYHELLTGRASYSLAEERLLKLRNSREVTDIDVYISSRWTNIKNKFEDLKDE